MRNRLLIVGLLLVAFAVLVGRDAAPAVSAPGSVIRGGSLDSNRAMERRPSERTVTVPRST